MVQEGHESPEDRSKTPKMVSTQDTSKTPHEGSKSTSNRAPKGKNGQRGP